MARPLIEVISAWRPDSDPFLHFYNHALKHLRDNGVEFLFHTDLERLQEVNQEHRARSWSPLMPMFDDVSYPGGQAVWIEGVSEQGETVMTEAVRLYHLNSLAEELRSLHLFYRDPAISAAPGESCLWTAPSAPDLGGKVACAGAGWARPDFRGRGFSCLVSRMVYGLASLLWQPDYVIAFVEPVLVQKGMIPRYGFPRHESEIWWYGSASEGNLELCLSWMTGMECAADLKRFDAGEDESRASAA